MGWTSLCLLTLPFLPSLGFSSNSEDQSGRHELSSDFVEEIIQGDLTNVQREIASFGKLSPIDQTFLIDILVKNTVNIELSDASLKELLSKWSATIIEPNLYSIEEMNKYGGHKNKSDRHTTVSDFVKFLIISNGQTERLDKFSEFLTFSTDQRQRTADLKRKDMLERQRRQEEEAQGKEK